MSKDMAVNFSFSIFNDFQKQSLENYLEMYFLNFKVPHIFKKPNSFPIDPMNRQINSL